MFRRILAAAAALAFLLPFAGCAAHAAAPPYITMTVGTCDPSYPTRCMKPNADGSINITGSVSAGAAFAPTGQATLSVTTTSARVALPAASANVTLVNTGAQTAYFLLGNGSVTATTTTGYPLQPGSSITLAVGANTNVAAITSTSTTSLSVTSGTGVPALAGGGSSGGGGGGAVTVADGADATQGAIADAAATAGSTGTLSAKIRLMTTQLNTLITNLGSPLQAGGTVTANLGTIAGASTSALQTTINNSVQSYIGTKAAGTAATNSALTGSVFTTNGSITLTNGQQIATQVDAKGSAKVSLFDSAGAYLDPTLASAVQCGTTTGTMVQCALASNQVLPDTAGASRYPQAGTSNRVLTATNLSANTNTTICPTATNPVSTEIFFTTAGVGIGLNGQTLTSASPGATTTNSPDIAINTAGTLYTAPVGISNAITAYGAAGVVRCIQTLRQ